MDIGATSKPPFSVDPLERYRSFKAEQDSLVLCVHIVTRRLTIRNYK